MADHHPGDGRCLNCMLSSIPNCNYRTNRPCTNCESRNVACGDPAFYTTMQRMGIANALHYPQNQGPPPGSDYQPRGAYDAPSSSYNGPPSGGSSYNGPPSGGYHYNGPPSGGYHYNGPPSGGYHYNGPTSGGYHYNGPPSGGYHYNGPSFGGHHHNTPSLGVYHYNTPSQHGFGNYNANYPPPPPPTPPPTGVPVINYYIGGRESANDGNNGHPNPNPHNYNNYNNNSGPTRGYGRPPNTRRINPKMWPIDKDTRKIIQSEAVKRWRDPQYDSETIRGLNGIERQYFDDRVWHYIHNPHPYSTRGNCTQQNMPPPSRSTSRAPQPRHYDTQAPEPEARNLKRKLDEQQETASPYEPRKALKPTDPSADPHPQYREDASRVSDVHGEKDVENEDDPIQGHNIRHSRGGPHGHDNSYRRDRLGRGGGRGRRGDHGHGQ